MRSPKFPVLPAMLFTALIAAAVVDCGGDDTTDVPAGGSSGKGGSAGGTAGSSTAGSSTAGSATAGNGGSAGASVGGNGGTGGSAGTGGKGGTGGTGDSGTDAAKDGAVTDVKVDSCATGVIHTAPTGLPSQVALQVTGATLIGGYHATGDQIYTCKETSDAGADAGDGALTGGWANTAEAVLTGDACVKAADHFYPGPTWKAVDGSTVSATRDDAIDPPGDGGAVTAIKWVRLKTTGNTGEGIFANVTWVQRINTTGGLQPSTPCDPNKAADAGSVVRVPYTADYFFYSGGTSSEAGSDASNASDDGSADSGG